MKQYGLATFIILLLITGCQTVQANLAATPSAAPTATPTATASAPATPSATPTSTSAPTATPKPTATPSPTPLPAPLVRRLTQGDCCTDAFWHGNNEIRFIDQDPQTGQTGLFALELNGPEPARRFVTDRLGFASPDERYLAYPDGDTGLAIIEDVTTGQSWPVDVGGSRVNFTPDSAHIWWVQADEDLPFESQRPALWLADLTGDNRRQITPPARISVAGWLDEQTMLVLRYTNDGSLSTLSTDQATLGKLSTVDGAVTNLLSLDRPRGISLNPAQTALIYFTTLSKKPENNGLWLVDLSQKSPAPVELPFVGAYAWQNDQWIIYVPFDITAASHFFYRYNIRTGQTEQLTGPDQPALTIANNDWAVSPDGTKIVLLASKNLALDGLWLVELEP